MKASSSSSCSIQSKGRDERSANRLSPGLCCCEGIVVHAQRRPVRGLADGDIERIGLIAAGEHGTAHLEQQEIEGGLEVLGEMRLDQRGADGPQIVGEPDADAGFLARLGAGVDRRCRRAGDPRRLKGAVLAFAVVRFGAVRGALALGHVFGADEALDEAQFAILADRCDASRDRAVRLQEFGPGFERRLDFVVARLDGVGFLDQRFRPLLVVEIGHLVLADLEPFEFGAFLLRGRCRGGDDAPEPGDGVPVHVEPRLGPLPLGPHLRGGGLELPCCELVQQCGIVEPDAVVVLVGEQVARYRAARRFIDFDADKAGDGRPRRNPVFGQHAFDLPCAGPVALLLHLLPDRDLAVPVGGDGEGGQDLQVDPALAVGFQQYGRGVAEAQTLLDQFFGNTEAHRDVGHGGAAPGEAGERLDLICRMHGGADHVLGQRQLALRRGIVADHAAGHGVIGRQHALAGQVDERGQAAAAGDYGVTAGAVGAGFDGAGDEVFQQPMGGDRGLELGERGLAGRCLADVGRRQLQLVERDRLDDGFRHGGHSPETGKPPGGGLRWMKVKAAATLPGARPSIRREPAFASWREGAVSRLEASVRAVAVERFVPGAVSGRGVRSVEQVVLGQRGCFQLGVGFVEPEPLSWISQARPSGPVRLATERSWAIHQSASAGSSWIRRSSLPRPLIMQGVQFPA